MALHLTFDDFWPPVQGGCERVVGFALPVSAAVALVGELSGHDLSSHPDLVAAVDGSDFLDFLEERAAEVGLAPPEQVVPASPGQSHLAVWPTASVSQSSELRAHLAAKGATSESTVKVWRGLWVAPGASLLFWVAALVSLIFYLRE